MSGARARSTSLLDWKGVVGVLLGAALLWFALRDVDAGEVVWGIRRADPVLLTIAVAGATFIFVIRAVRWRSLLEPVRPDSAFRPRFAATTIGFMANNLLPARIGEFVRAYALSRLEPVPVAASFGSLVVERLLDGFTITGFLFLAMALPGFPAVGPVGGRAVDSTAFFVLAVFGAVAVVLFATVLWPDRVLAAFDSTLGRVMPRSVARPVHDALRALVSGFATLRRPSLLLRAAVWSVVLWLVGAASFWVAFRAFDIEAPFSGALFLQSLISLAVALPAAPGFFGLYEAGVRIGLVQVWGVPVNAAMSFAIGFHMASFLPVTAIGLYYAWRLGISWRQVEESEEVTERAVEAEEAREARARRRREPGRAGAGPERTGEQ